MSSKKKRKANNDQKQNIESIQQVTPFQWIVPDDVYLKTGGEGIIDGRVQVEYDPIPWWRDKVRPY